MQVQLKLAHSQLSKLSFQSGVRVPVGIVNGCLWLKMIAVVGTLRLDVIEPQDVVLGIAIRGRLGIGPTPKKQTKQGSLRKLN